METKQVPWWRKALDFALSGLRSGFGLFSRSEKNHAAIEPEIVAGQNEIREEAELTDHSPKQDHIVAASEQPEPVAQPEVEVAAEPVAEFPAEQEAFAPANKETAQELEAVPETEALEAATQPFAEPEEQPQAALELPAEAIEKGEVDSVQAAGSPEPAPDGGVEAKPVPEVSVPMEIAVEAAVTEPEPEALPEAETETADKPVTEVDAVPMQTESDPEPASDLEIESEQRLEEAATSPETAVESVAAKLDQETEAAVEPEAASEAEEAAPLDTEQPPADLNELVDEAAPEAQSAIGEDLEPVPVSLNADEKPEPVAQVSDEQAATEEHGEIIEAPMDGIAEDETGAVQATAQSEEPPAESSVAETTEESTTDAVEPPMELNHSNQEASAEQEHAAETAEPIPAAEEPAAAPEPEAVVEQAAPAAEADAEPAEDAEAPVQEVAAVQHPSKPFIKREPREGEADNSPFSVIVSQVYDGPLDLLLDLIRKQDIDIYDIPIARITAQFLAYVNQLKASDVDVAGEFIYTASLLIHIKSKMLLPRAPSGPEDAAEDPRRELVERLLEHERFKNAAQMLQQKQMLEAATWTNPGVSEFKEDTEAEPEIAADTVDLVRVFRDILERARNRPVLNVQEDSVTVGQMIQFVSRRLSMEDKPMALRKLLSHSRSERALIAMFLALLELVRLQAILLRQDRAFSEIFVKKHSNFENVMTETASAQDDWK